MRVCYFFSTELKAAKAVLPVGTEVISTAESPWSYWKELEDRWTGNDDLLIIEQDIIIHDQVISQLENCTQDWCIFPYVYGSGSVINISGPKIMTRGLGCTYFSAKLQSLFPLTAIFDHPKTVLARQGCSGLVCSEDAMCWRHIDQTINHTLESAGCNPHRHAPFVRHEHYADEIVPESRPAIEATEMILTVKAK